MGWLSRIFKRYKHKVSRGKCGWSCEAHREENHPSTSLESCSDAEDVGSDIALSLSDEDQRGKNVIAEPQQNEDEQLARAIQDRLNVKSPPWQGNQNGNWQGHVPYGYNNGNFYQPLSYAPNYSLICAGCNGEIGYGVRFLNCMGTFWHAECFRCHACNQPITDYEFSVYGNYYYHRACYNAHYHPQCDVCKHFIPINAVGIVGYRAHPFWSQKYCPFHEQDGTPRCCSCERMEPRDKKFVTHRDGRKLCMECLDSAVMDTSECQHLCLEIQQFYEGLDMEVEQKIPFRLVEKQTLNEVIDAVGYGHLHVAEARGLCLSVEKTVATILRTPEMGTGNPVMDLSTEPYKLTCWCQVAAILILYGLPRLLTGSIFAHEMMHAWLRLKGYRTASLDVEEGMCQVMAHMWLETEIMHLSCGTNTSASYLSKQSPYERKLGEFFKQQIECDTSPVYGTGYRAGKQAVLKYGLKGTLEHIRMTGTFPY